MKYKNKKNAFIVFISGLVRNNLEKLNEEEINSLSRKIYLLYEGAVNESHLHQEYWPIKEAKSLCSKKIYQKTNRQVCLVMIGNVYIRS